VGDALGVRARALWIALVWFAALGCGPDQVSAIGGDETGGDQPTVAPGHWLLYTAASGDSEPLLSLRAVDLGGLDEGHIGEPVELLEFAEDAYRSLGPTPSGAWAFELDDAYMLVGLDAAGQIELYPGVPDDVPAKIGRPKFSADGSIALFRGEITWPIDNFYWVRFEHGHPVEGRALGPMPTQISLDYWISPNGTYGVIGRDDEQNQWRLYRFELGPEPGEQLPLFDDDPLYVAALFEQHLFAWTMHGQLHVGEQLMLVDMSSGEAGERYPVSPGQVGVATQAWFSPTGDTVVWLDIPFSYGSSDERGKLWRVDVVDGVPLPAVELSGPDEYVAAHHVYLLGDRLAWQPLTDGEQSYSRLRWVDLEDGGLAPIRTIDEGAWMMVSPRWSPDGRWVAWVGDVDSPLGESAWMSVAALDGPELNVARPLDQLAANIGVVWIGDRMLYQTAGYTRLWSVKLGEAGPGPSSPLHPAFGPVRQIMASHAVIGHDAAVVSVVPELDASGHLQLLRFGADEQLETARIDDDPRSQRVIHQIVRE